MFPNEIVISKSSKEHPYQFNPMKFSYQEISFCTNDIFKIQKLIKLILSIYFICQANEIDFCICYVTSLMRFFHLSV